MSVRPNPLLTVLVSRKCYRCYLFLFGLKNAVASGAWAEVPMLLVYPADRSCSF